MLAPRRTDAKMANAASIVATMSAEICPAVTFAPKRLTTPRYATINAKLTAASIAPTRLSLFLIRRITFLTMSASGASTDNAISIPIVA